VAAVARHGLAKLDMGAVSESAGVSRGTLYRYFSGRDDLLRQVAVHESVRFWEDCLRALREAPEGPERVSLLLAQATRQARAHPALATLLRREPAFLLRAVQSEFPAIRAQLARELAPLLEATPLVARGRVGAPALVDWLARLLFSFFLIPEAGTPRSLAAIPELLAATPAEPAP